jgi:hypothetical protein
MLQSICIYIIKMITLVERCWAYVRVGLDNRWEPVLNPNPAVIFNSFPLICYPCCYNANEILIKVVLCEL